MGEELGVCDILTERVDDLTGFHQSIEAVCKKWTGH